MGIVNLTPDSFSGGSLPPPSPREASDMAIDLIHAGADIIDFGAESTRPGADPIGTAREINRLGDVVKLTRLRTDVPLSVDTYHAETAEHALAQGADIVNDVSALRRNWNAAGDHDDNDAMLEAVKKYQAHLILMHAPAAPAVMQNDPHYCDVLAEVISFLVNRARYAEQSGVERKRIWLDPGFGFGKTFAHNRALLLGIGQIAAAGYPVLAGLSRKRLIKDALGLPLEQRLEASLALAVIASLNGAAMVRVHDVKETARAVGMADAIRLNRAAP